MPSEIRRGEIYWVDWSPGRGHEQIGIRPALIIQNDIGNKASPTTIVASCSAARKKPYPFIVPVSAAESGLSENSSIDLAHIMTIENTRLCDKCGELSKEKMDEVNEAIKKSLGLDERLHIVE